MVIGAYFSGRAAGKMSGVRLANIGFLFCGISAALNIPYHYFFTEIALPWAVIPMVLSAFGVALVFPILTIAILDMYPNQRGSASSMQAFVGLLSNAMIAGLLSPALSHSGLYLALAAGAFSLVAYALWLWYLTHTDKLPQAPKDAENYEPQDEM